uniref:Uncharacterized protein n=1 Tax=Phlebotomus papatasi TaxID=29031 RepID=A0A1B0D7I6_PHLPP
MELIRDVVRQLKSNPNQLPQPIQPRRNMDKRDEMSSSSSLTQMFDPQIISHEPLAGNFFGAHDDRGGATGSDESVGSGEMEQRRDGDDGISRKTSTASECTISSSEYTPENTVMGEMDEEKASGQQMVRKVSRYLGHFMTVDNLRHIRHGGARLLSPIYNATYSRGCFRFYYNMYGAAVGTFTIYQKPLSVSMDGIKDFVVLFTISGNRGNLWNSGDVFLEIMTEPFQIVLEATMASTSADISIDDVELDVNCRSTYPTEWTESTESTSSPTVTDIGIYSVDSCVKRCSENATVATNGSFIKDHLDIGLTMKCDCHPDCLDLKSCCPDYLEICLGDTDIPTSVTGTYTDTLNHLQTYNFEHTVIVSSGIASILLILLISVLLLWHHRRKIHHSRKSVDVVFEKKKFNHEDGDDSDIKCLTSRMDDEELDFTLMTNDNVSDL